MWISETNNQPITKFQASVYKLISRIPSGKISTYQQVARGLKNPRAARAVGNALNRNPFAPEVPCHRIIKSNGAVGGFADGTKKKIAMLRKERVEIKKGKINLDKYLYVFPK
ncbi:MAG: MGMT family protein [Candidatus Falkowbacteria bacterium]|nr:MGMT family protein [Candidatus Falkowbacteria bacterium]